MPGQPIWPRGRRLATARGLRRWSEGGLDVDRHGCRTPVETHDRLVAKHHREIDRERLHVRCLFWRHIDAQHVEFGAGIWFMKHVRGSAENHSPWRPLTRDEPKRVLAGA